MPEISFYFDYLSPYAYLAHTQLRLIGAPIAYHPFDIRKAMQDAGNIPTSVTCKPKNRYVQADLRRWIDRYGVPFQRHPSVAAIDSNRLLRATLWAQRRGPVQDVVTVLFDALWGKPAPLDSAADVADLVRRAGFDALGPDAEIDAPALGEALAHATDAAVARGVFGAPTMFVGDEMFFGNDRLDFVKARLAL